jgi:hypothetical protein
MVLPSHNLDWRPPNASNLCVFLKLFMNVPLKWIVKANEAKIEVL